ncbi:MAG: hypothetical protein AABX23_01845 [Nanoarchaeota archaeon]
MKNKKQDNGLVIVLIILVIVLFSGFSMMSFGGYGMMGMMGYGNSYLCSQIGGIWCYFPIFGFLFMILSLVVFIVLLVWIVKQLQNDGRRNVGRN